MSVLHDLAAAAGLQIAWEDAASRPQEVRDEALENILTALGLETDGERAIAHSLERLEEEAAAANFVSADCGEPVMLPPAMLRPGTAELVLEDGTSRSVEIVKDGTALRTAPIHAIGYHRLVLGGREIRVAVSPARCRSIGDIAPGRRLWGPAIQIPSLIDRRASAFGDFGSLREAAGAFAARGADAMAISPVHALFPADASRYSPYGPSSRLFLNILLADPSLLGHPVAGSPLQPLIDWRTAIPQRLAELESAWAASRGRIHGEVERFARAGGDELRLHATFDVLHAQFFHKAPEGWQAWPTEYHEPGGRAVAAFTADHREQIEFYIFAQWLATRSLEAAHREAKDAGMAVGLIADLAVGMDRGGSQAWSRPSDLLGGVSIGAPPDLLGPDGQNWGLAAFSPTALRRTGFDAFIATLRSALDHAGGIRIDHILGLNRMWIIPDGASASDGAYLRYPLEDMLRILAIESWRTGAIVIGEDLGTVPEGLRPALDARGVMGMRVLPFERTESGDFIPPRRWSRRAVAMTGTHDLPTTAGWWCGRDIEWTWRIGRASQAASEADEHMLRTRERTRLWQACKAAGAARGPEPAASAPQAAVDAAVSHVAGAACELAIVPLEDIFGLIEQPNLPGTMDEHPNWRRRMPDSTEALLERPEVVRRLDKLNEARRS